jgi:hypothetical protein
VKNHTSTSVENHTTSSNDYGELDYTKDYKKGSSEAVAPECDDYPCIDSLPKKFAKVKHLVKEALDFWKSEMGKATDFAKQDKINQKRAATLAKEFYGGMALDEFKNAVRGCKSSAYHMGQNESARCYNDIEYIVRPKNFEAWRNYGGEGRPMTVAEMQEEKAKDPEYLNQLAQSLGYPPMFGHCVDGEVIQNKLPG